MTEERIIELETKLTFQEEATTELTKTVLALTTRINEMENRLKKLEAAYEEVISGPREKPPIEKPPHY